MTTEMTTNQSFQERMFERIRSQMGDLMTEVELKALVDTAMQKAFFEPQVKKDRWGDKTEHPSQFMVMLKESMQEQVAKEIKEWLSTHPEEVAKAIDETLAKGMFGLIQQYIEAAASGPMMTLANNLRAKGVLG